MYYRGFPGMSLRCLWFLSALQLKIKGRDCGTINGHDESASIQTLMKDAREVLVRLSDTYILYNRQIGLTGSNPLSWTVAPLQGERHRFAIPRVCMPWAPFYTLRHIYSAACQTALPVDDGWSLFINTFGDSMFPWSCLCGVLFTMNSWSIENYGLFMNNESV